MNLAQWTDKYFDRQRDWALITGASSGIGHEYLKAISSLGIQCVATSNNREELTRVCSALHDEGRPAILPIVADLANPKGRSELLNTIREMPIRLLVSNAGIGVKGLFVNNHAEDLEHVVGVNALAPIMLLRSVLPDMVANRRGLVIQVASINACSPIAYNAVYTGTKVCCLYVLYAIQYENRHSGVTFQICLPGTTNTPFHSRQGATPTALFMEPDEVVRRSLSRVDSLISISNRVDAMMYPFIMAMPLWLRLRIATFLLKRRLKLDV